LLEIPHHYCSSWNKQRAYYFFGGLRLKKGSLQLLIEQLILMQILEIEEESGTSLTGTNQHGCKKECSTITASVDIQSRVAALMDQDQYVVVASLDLSAAFDVVNVDLLLVRLKKMGLPTEIINLLESWLKDRQSYVEVRNCCSQYLGQFCSVCL
jgi:hypothetical protein